MRWAEDATAGNTGTTLTLALNYGGRSELVDAFRGLAAEMKQRHQSAEHITEEDIHRHLYTAHMPDPDLLIRSSGEMRISNFLLWQVAYTAASICSKPSPTSSSASAASAGWARAAAKWKKTPSESRSRRVEASAD
jgi:undecaprenyl diphosphate synthase